ncbi:MAG: hypothetical protein PHO70_04985 [Candidatus Omnitrophica bacterium]|nr:hypothetical protein [Candidatus Omnitrophota bacterium]
MNDLRALAIGIGSLPHRDADSALDLIFKYLPEVPFWPQLPKRDICEGMIAQFSQNLPCLKISPEGLFFNAKNQEAELEKFYEEVISNNSDYFSISSDFALGLSKLYQRLKKEDLSQVKYIKCQVTGPFTFAAGLNDENGVALLHNEVFWQVIMKGLIMKARWQLDLFREFGKKLIIFIDEPYLGCFGSAYTPLTREAVVKGLVEFTEAIDSKDCLLGIHCCGNTDWSMFTDVKAIDIINFDAFDFQDKFLLYAKDLNAFLKRNGLICWGVVPTQSISDKETAASLAKKVAEGADILVKKGADRDLAFENLTLSTACGLGTLTVEEAEARFSLLAETSQILRKNQ